MRKLLIAGVSAAALFSAGAALADNSTSNVSQDAASTGATVSVTQSGPVGSFSDIVQQNVGGGNVTIFQTDNGAGGTGLGLANVSYVKQDNASTYGGQPISQVAVSQNHNLGGGGNYSNVDQGPIVASTVSVTQVGADNSSDVFQRYQERDLVTVSQAGALNASTIDQTNLYESIATVSQIGTGGALNLASITQGPSGFTGPDQAWGETAGISQNGSGNTSYITQIKSGDYANAATANYASNVQDGDYHYSSISQLGIDNYAAVDQSGFANTSTVDQQLDSVDVAATVVQSGAFNTSNIVQAGTNNDAWVTQASNGNTSNISQLGSNSTVIVSQ